MYIYIYIYLYIYIWWWWLLLLSLLKKKCSNCVWNSLVFSYLDSHSEWSCLRCLSCCRWWKTEKYSCRSSVISMRSYPPLYPRSSTPLNPSPSLFLFSFFSSPPFSLFPSFFVPSFSFYPFSFLYFFLDWPHPLFFFLAIFFPTVFYFLFCVCVWLNISDTSKKLY